MSFKNDKSLDLIEEVLRTHKVIGYEKTKAAVTSARDIGDQFQNQRLLEAFIFKECCKKFRVPQQQVLYGRSNGTRTECLMVVFVLIKKHFGYSNAKIGKTYRKSSTIVTKAIGKYNAIKEHDKISVGIVTKAKQINEAVLAYKENLYK